MKKVFKKFQMWMIALVAMFACSMVSFAQDVTFDFSGNPANHVFEKDGVTVQLAEPYYMDNSWMGLNLYLFDDPDNGTYWDITVASQNAAIEKIVLTATGAVSTITTSVGAFSSLTWTGNSNSVIFSQGKDQADAYVTRIDVYFAGATPQPAEYKTGESISEGELDAQNNSLVYLYFEGHAMESVDYTQITVGGNAIQSWQLGFWPSSNDEQFSVTFGNAMPLVAGDYTIVIPEGAIKFKDGKVNEEIELEYYVLPAPVYVNVFESASVAPGEVTVDAFQYGLYISTDRVFEEKGLKATVNGEEVATYFYGAQQQIFVGLLNVEVGNTYTVVLPAGAILVADNTFNEEITLTYTVPAPYVPKTLPVEVIQGAQYVHVTLPVTVEDTQNWEANPAGITVKNANGEALAIAQAWTGWHTTTLSIELAEAPAVAGVYTVEVAAGVVNDVVDNLVGQFTVEAKPIQTTATFSDNGYGGYVEVALPEALTASFFQYDYQLEGVVTVVDAQNNAVVYGYVMGNEGDNKVTIGFYQGQTPAAGTYTVTIGADLLAPGYYADFTVLPAPVYVDVLDYAYPAAGEVKVEAFANGLYIFTNYAFEAVEGAKATVNGEEVMSFFYGGDQNIFVSLLNVEAGNTYTVVIPAGAIRVADNTYNKEITLTYTIPVDPITVPVEQASQYVYVTLPVTTTDAKNWGWAWGEYQGAIPAGLEVLDPKGNAVAVKSVYYYYDSTFFGIELEEVPTAGGEYTVNIPAGVVTGLAAPLTGKFIIPVKPVVVDVQQGGQYVNVSLPITTTDYNSWGWAWGEWTTDFPAGLEVLDPNGEAVAIKSAFYNYESTVFQIELEATPEVYGEYTVNVPANVVTGIEVPMTGKFTVSPVPGATINFVAEDPNVSGMYWATYYADYAWEVPAGVFAYTVTGIDEHNRAETALVEDVVPAKTGVVLVRMEAGEVKIVKSNESPAPIEGNLLRGVTTDQTVTAADGESLYKLSYNNDETKLGFYWDAANGASLEATAYKAYLAVPAAAASNGISVRFGELTGIDTVLASEAGEAIYNLQGQRVSAAQAGVYVKNGKKFIVK